VMLYVERGRQSCGIPGQVVSEYDAAHARLARVGLAHQQNLLFRHFETSSTPPEKGRICDVHKSLLSVLDNQLSQRAQRKRGQQHERQASSRGHSLSTSSSRCHYDMQSHPDFISEEWQTKNSKGTQAMPHLFLFRYIAERAFAMPSSASLALAAHQKIRSASAVQQKSLTCKLVTLFDTQPCFLMSATMTVQIQK
jgi:hypothetical protein